MVAMAEEVLAVKARKTRSKSTNPLTRQDGGISGSKAKEDFSSGPFEDSTKEEACKTQQEGKERQKAEAAGRENTQTASNLRNQERTVEAVGGLQRPQRVAHAPVYGLPKKARLKLARAHLDLLLNQVRTACMQHKYKYRALYSQPCRPSTRGRSRWTSQGTPQNQATLTGHQNTATGKSLEKKGSGTTAWTSAGSVKSTTLTSQNPSYTTTTRTRSSILGTSGRGQRCRLPAECTGRLQGLGLTSSVSSRGTASKRGTSLSDRRLPFCASSWTEPRQRTSQRLAGSQKTNNTMEWHYPARSKTHTRPTPQSEWTARQQSTQPCNFVRRLASQRSSTCPSRSDKGKWASHTQNTISNAWEIPQKMETPYQQSNSYATWQTKRESQVGEQPRAGHTNNKSGQKPIYPQAGHGREHAAPRNAWHSEIWEMEQRKGTSASSTYKEGAKRACYASLHMLPGNPHTDITSTGTQGTSSTRPQQVITTSRMHSNHTRVSNSTTRHTACSTTSWMSKKEQASSCQWTVAAMRDKCSSSTSRETTQPRGQGRKSFAEQGTQYPTRGSGPDQPSQTKCAPNASQFKKGTDQEGQGRGQGPCTHTATRTEQRHGKVRNQSPKIC